MAYTQADIDALDAEISKVRAVKSLAFGDQSTVFRDLDELLRMRAVMVAQIAATAGISRTRYASTRKGV
jgi:hypothetical protein